MAEVSEGFLIGDDRDVELGGVGDELASVGGGHAAAGGGGERVGGVLLGVFEVGRVEIVLVGGEGADELLLELEGVDGAAGDVVGEAAVLHGGPVADGGDLEGCLRAVAYESCLTVWRA